MKKLLFRNLSIIQGFWKQKMNKIYTYESKLYFMFSLFNHLFSQHWFKKICLYRQLHYVDCQVTIGTHENLWHRDLFRLHSKEHTIFLNWIPSTYYVYRFPWIKSKGLIFNKHLKKHIILNFTIIGNILQQISFHYSTVYQINITKLKDLLQQEKW